MPTTTTTYSFNKPVVGADEDAWGGYLNGNWDSVDDLLDGTTPVTGIDINSGTLDGVTIGGTTAGAGTFTTLTANTSITGTLATAAQTNITSVGTLTGLTVSGSTSLAGASTSADITFGDNDKAIFGAGSDLQIYHDGSNSYISDQGTGSLRVIGTNVVINNSANTSNMAIFNDGSDVRLFYNGDKKFETTSTGIDVTGTVTADELYLAGTSQNSFITGSSSPVLYRSSGGGTFPGFDLAGNLIMQPRSNSQRDIVFAASNDNTNVQPKMIIQANGDISFYEDTGTTAKFFWDASAESLGIGTSSPSSPLTINRSTDGDCIEFETAGTIVGKISTDAGRALVFDADPVPGGATATTMRFNVDATERMRIDSSGNVGIGTSSPQEHLHVSGTGTQRLEVETTQAANSAILKLTSTAGSYGVISDGSDALTFYDYGSSAERMRIDSSGYIISTASNPQISFVDSANSSYKWSIQNTSSAIRFYDNTASSERMRIDSSGNLLVGRTSSSGFTTSAGSALFPNGSIFTTVDGGQALNVSRLTSDGDIVGFYKDGTKVGSIGAFGGRIYAGSGDVGLTFFHSGSDFIQPFNPSTNAGRDNAIDLGNSSNRFDDIYATNGTIQTSDQNEKQQIASLTDAEITAAKAISKLFKTFKWNDSVTEKGDAARTHTGVIAQQVEVAMTDAGLDAGNYAFFISTTWYVDADGNEVDADTDGAITKNRKGIRYPQLLSFVAAATEQRLASIETRLDALEA